MALGVEAGPAAPCLSLNPGCPAHGLHDPGLGVESGCAKVPCL